MSGINDIVNSFNIGFFQTTNNNKNPVDLNIPKDSEFADFEETLKVVSSEAYIPSPSEYVQLDGFRFDDNNKEIPTKITLEGVFA